MPYLWPLTVRTEAWRSPVIDSFIAPLHYQLRNEVYENHSIGISGPLRRSVSTKPDLSSAAIRRML